MIEDTRNAAERSTAEAASGGHGEPITAFCQQCGRALTPSSRRQVGSGIFCEPCATAQPTSAAHWASVAGGTAPSYPPGATPPTSTEPNPMLAGFFGLIPGVGAMYNGQYPKGALHLIVFVVLVSMADNLNWVFWWFVWGWVFYQAFDAYHTAQARRDGLPLPDPFGWTELTDRLGGGRHWPPATHAAPAQSGYVPNFVPHTAPPPPSVDFGAEPQQANASSAGAAPLHDFVPGNPLGSAAYGPAFTEPFAYTAGPTGVPYAPTFTGTAAPAPEVEITVGSRRFPTAAVWLIGLGILFLLGSILPSWRLDGRWFVPILLAGIAIWTGTRRVIALRGVQRMRMGSLVAVPSIAGFANVLLGPTLLLTLAILLMLQAADLVLLRHSWPALLIVWGALLAVERSRPPERGAVSPTMAEPSIPSGPDAFPS